MTDFNKPREAIRELPDNICLVQPVTINDQPSRVAIPFAATELITALDLKSLESRLTLAEDYIKVLEGIVSKVELSGDEAAKLAGVKFVWEAG